MEILTDTTDTVWLLTLQDFTVEVLKDTITPDLAGSFITKAIIPDRILLTSYYVNDYSRCRIITKAVESEYDYVVYIEAFYCQALVPVAPCLQTEADYTEETHSP